MNNPLESNCEEMGHGVLVFLGSSKDGLEREYICLECKRHLTTLNSEEGLSLSEEEKGES